MEQLLSQALAHLVLTSHHPRTAICVVVQVLSADGALLAACLHGACLALVHAGVPLRGILGGCAVSVLPHGEILLDPCAEEERTAQATVTLVYQCRHRAHGAMDPLLLLSHLCGHMTEAQFDICRAAGQEAALAVAMFQQSAMSRSV